MDDSLDPTNASAQAASPVAEPRPGPGSFPGPQHPWRRPAGALARWKKRLGEAKATWPLTTGLGATVLVTCTSERGAMLVNVQVIAAPAKVCPLAPPGMV